VGPQGQPLPFQNEEEVIAFLTTARVDSFKRIENSTNRPYKVLLEKDGIRAHAVFRDVHIYFSRARTANGMERNFRDEAIFEVAAFELARMLQLDLVPPTIERRLFGRRGSLQLWIEDAFSETDRVRTGRSPEDLREWQQQHELMVLFDNLIYNVDRNQGNILYDPGWRRWLIDHTRAFRTKGKLLSPHRIMRCARAFWDHLVRLDPKLVRQRLGPYLSRVQLSALLKRYARLVDHLQSRIDRWGEGSVLVDLADRPLSGAG
jgi:hypothetical protein